MIVCSYRLSTAPQSHPQGDICSALQRLLRSRTDNKKRWPVLREVAATAGFRMISVQEGAGSFCGERSLAGVPAHSGAGRIDDRQARFSAALMGLGAAFTKPPTALAIADVTDFRCRLGAAPLAHDSGSIVSRQQFDIVLWRSRVPYSQDFQVERGRRARSEERRVG